MIDERKGLPSASGYARLLNCLGSWALESSIAPEDAPEESETVQTVGASGDKIHAFMAGLPVELEDAEERVAEKFKREEAELVAEFIGDPAITMREERLWFKMDGHERFSGKFDAVFVGEDALLVIDYKSGWLGAEAAPKNPQLRAGVVLVNRKFHAMNRPIIVAVLSRFGRPTAAEYDMHDILASESELRGALVDAEKPDAPLTPGKWCDYCKARLICSALKAEREQLAVIDTRKLTLTDVQRILDVGPAIEKVLESAKARAKKALTEDPAAIPGWELKPGAEKEKVRDLQVLYTRMSEYGTAPEEFAKACSITKSSLTALLRQKTGAKGRELDALLDAATAGIVEISTTSPSLKRTNT